MAKKTLAIASTEKQYNAVHNQLDAHNNDKKLPDKITMSRFLFELLQLGFKLYKMNNNDFEQAYKFVNNIENKREIKQQQAERKQELAAENIVETNDVKSFIKAKIGILK